MRLTLLFCILVQLQCPAQEWQVSYDKARAAFEQEKYHEAIEAAEVAYSIAQKLEPKNQAYSLQILTASCVEADLFEKGLSVIDTEIDRFATLDINGKNHKQAISKKARLLVAANRVQEAVNSYQLLLSIHEVTGDKSSYDYLKTLADEADANLLIKEYQKAKRSYDKCLPGLKTNPDASEDYFYCLFNAALTEHFLGSDGIAAGKLSEFISIAEKNSLTTLDEYTKARTLLSSINRNTGNTSGLMLPEDKAIQLLNRAIVSQNSNPQEAYKLYTECEEVIRSANLVNNTSFSCYLNHSRFLYSIKDMSGAMASAKSARAHAEKLFNASSKEFTALQILEADLAFAEGKNTEAVTLYRAVFAGNKDVAAAFVSQARWMGDQLSHYNLDSESMTLIGNFLKDPSFESVPTIDKLQIYKTYATACLGALQSVTLLKESEQKLVSEKDADVRQMLMLSCAFALDEAGTLNRALDYLLSAQNIESKNLIKGELHFELARIKQKLGDYRDAELNYRKAIDNISASLSPASFVPQLYNSFATFYIQLGNYEAAENLFVRLLEKPDNSSFQSAVRQNLAALYEQTGQYPKAKKLLVGTIAFDREHIGEFHPDYAISLQNLASLYQKLNKLDSAKILFEQALAIDQKNSGDGSVTYAAKLANLGTVYQDAGDFGKARQLLERSLVLRKTLLGPDHPDYAFNSYNLGYLLYRTGQSQAALPYLHEAAGYYLRQIKDVFPILSDYERTAFYNKIQPVIDGYQAYLVETSSTKPSLAEDLLNFRIETKALLLSASVKVRNQIISSGNPTLVQKFANWQHTKEQLATLYSLPLNERQANAAAINEYSKKANDLEKELSSDSEIFASTLSTGTVDWKKIQARLKPEEAVMEIIRVTLPSDSIVYAAIVVKPSASAPQLIVIPKGRMLEGRGFKRYMNGIHYENRDLNSFDIFWTHFKKAIDGVKVLYMSPDGVYNKINCLTLFDPALQEFVIDRLNIQLISSLKELLATEDESSQKKEAVVIGYPDYDLGIAGAPIVEDTHRSFFGDIAKGIADLPGTLEEVTEIDKTLKKYQWNVQLRTKDLAREEAVKAAKNPELLHIATHGFFIAPAQDNPKHVSGNDLANIEHNVMLRSGLLLAGVEKFVREKSIKGSPEKSDDGVLTAFEVMNLNLDDTELVVLSACETGAGDVRNGEGVYGLQRAFMLAGAKNLIMSLWKVDDRATQELMIQFYSTWAGGKDVKTSFYETQLVMKNKFKSPAYWGAFVGIGGR